MNMETAKRLYECRKSAGYSQEMLAEKIGVSRQAISKWERGESSPDTDNLIALSKVYNITIDELINSDVKPEKKSEETAEEAAEEYVSFKNGIHVHNGTDKVDIDFSGIHVETNKGESVHIGKGRGVHIDGIDEKYILKHHKAFSMIEALVPILSIIAFLAVGFALENGWKYSWLIFLLIPIIESFIEAVKHRDPNRFAYPVFVAGVYLTYGMCMSVWHPTWIIFLTIPIYYIVFGILKPKKEKKNTN
ncbi:MAG: helix-turn-helix transcriptional regulator [Acetobacter sp.]|nr:helix-turn-helix transcriptional regulator [Bacteroides sp.]MCM1341825.1 helix-turn-helix transcriptional regulator [Acetobacter sp.]MCM1433991.1 helix-turn-helix transcriptional regulator [Clostridiales bacterium]